MLYVLIRIFLMIQFLWVPTKCILQGSPTQPKLGDVFIRKVIFYGFVTKYTVQYWKWDNSYSVPSHTLSDRSKKLLQNVIFCIHYSEVSQITKHWRQ